MGSCDLGVGPDPPHHISVPCCVNDMQWPWVLGALAASVAGKLPACIYIDSRVLDLMVNLLNEKPLSS